MYIITIEMVNGKTTGTIVLSIIIIIAIAAIVIITSKSQCKVPPESGGNPCQSESTTQPMYPYCDGSGDVYQCGSGEQVCGDISGACPSGQVAESCNWETQQWSCESDTPTPTPSKTVCTVSDGKLNHPIAYDNKLHPTMTKPLKHYKSYKEITISGAKGCELASCNGDYDVSDNSSFCVSRDKGSACDDTSYKQFDTTEYSVYPDPNATWTKAYAFPDGDTALCKFKECVDGYSFDTKLKKCVKGGGGKGDCGALPAHADQSTSQCESDGSWHVTKCNSDSTYKYSPTSDNRSCEKSGCVATCGRFEADCVLDPTNKDDIFCSAYDNQAMGTNKDAILAYAATKGNMSLSDKSGIVAKKGDVTNPWGGCGNSKLKEFMPDPDTGKCVVPTEYSWYKFMPFVDKDYKVNKNPGCSECAPLICSGIPKPDWSNCTNYVKDSGCQNMVEGGDWVKKCKDSQSLTGNFGWGTESNGYLPIVVTNIMIEPWTDSKYPIAVTFTTYDKNCKVIYTKLYDTSGEGGGERNGWSDPITIPNTEEVAWFEIKSHATDEGKTFYARYPIEDVVRVFAHNITKSGNGLSVYRYNHFNVSLYGVDDESKVLRTACGK